LQVSPIFVFRQVEAVDLLCLEVDVPDRYRAVWRAIEGLTVCLVDILLPGGGGVLVDDDLAVGSATVNRVVGGSGDS